MVTELTLVRGACPHDCPDTCAWTVTVEDGRATALKADPDHPFTRGGLCAKVNHYLDDRVYHPDRLLHALKRSGPKGSGAFVQVGLDEAIADIARRLQEIVGQYGGEAVLPYSYMGTQGLVQGSSIDRRFFSRLGATRLERAICGSAGGSGVSMTNGSVDGVLPEDFVHSRFIVLWGTNTVVTNLHLWPFIRTAQERGATVVVVDPVRTRTAEAADWYVRPRPGTDAALALGLMHVVVADGRHDADYVAKYTHGFEQLKDRLADYPPERVAEITGVPAEEVVRLARAYARTRPSVIRVLIGMEHHARGAAAFRAIACLPALVGAWRDLGGGLMHVTAGLFFPALRADRMEMPELEDPATREVNMVQLGQALTDVTLDPPIKALVVHSSNPAAIAPNQNAVLAGLRREDLFTVVHEQVMTDTARHADYVLPATTEVEHWDLLWSWGQTYVTLNQPAIAPRGDAVSNTELFRRLARAMGYDEPYLFEPDEALVRTALTSDHPYLAGITFERLLEQGWAPLTLPTPYLPYAEGGFATPSGKCEFFSSRLADAGLDPLPGWEPAGESPAGNPELARRYPLMLISGKGSLHFLNSSYANVERHVRAERRPRVDIHPDDAAARGITDDAPVRVHNDRGVLELSARVTDRVGPGVVSIPSGWWASRSPGGSSVNALTPDGLSDLGGGGDFHDALVEVSLGAGPPPG